MVLFLNATNGFGLLVQQGTLWTGSMFTTLMIIIVALFLFGIILHIPLDILLAIMSIPLIVAASVYTQFVLFIAIILITLAWIIARLFL